MQESSIQSLNVEFINPHIIYSHVISNIISDKRTTFVIFLAVILLLVKARHLSLVYETFG